MSLPRSFILVDDSVRQRVSNFALKEAPAGCVAKFMEPSRSLEQNAAQWPILEEFSCQLKWPVNGALVHMTDEEWKDVLTAAFRGETVRLAQGLDGGVVMLGMRTSKMSKKQFGEWLTFLHATAAQRGVSIGLGIDG